MAEKNSCDFCMHNEYNEEYECWQCGITLDEDEMMSLLNNKYHTCPHFKFGDEYKIVKKQM